MNLLVELHTAINGMGSGRLRGFSLSNRNEARAGYNPPKTCTKPATTYTKRWWFVFSILLDTLKFQVHYVQKVLFRRNSLQFLKRLL